MSPPQRVKLVFVITGLATGGAEMMLLKLLERLDRTRFSPLVISLTTTGEIGPCIAALGIPVEAVGMNKGLAGVLAFPRLVARLRGIKPDVVHTWMYHSDLLGGVAARLAGIRSVVWGVRHSNLSPALNKRTTLWVARLCALVSPWVPVRIACCSEAARQVHARFGYAAGKMVVVPNGFDLNRFRPDDEARRTVRRELGLREHTRLVGLVGRFDSQKNHAGFFKAAGLLRAWLPDVHFVLAGKDIEAGNPDISRWMAEAKVADVTHLLGVRNDIPRLMAGLDVLVSSSDGEAFPNVLGEAMACGVPCVVTDVGDSAYIVGDTGRVVAAGDMAGLATATLELLDLPADKRTALGQQARHRLAQLFEIGTVVKQYEALYEELAVCQEGRR